MIYVMCLYSLLWPMGVYYYTVDIIVRIVYIHDMNHVLFMCVREEYIIIYIILFRPSIYVRFSLPR